MKCPECRSVLVTLEFDRIEIDYCPGCRGIWLDSGELRALLEREERDGFLAIAADHVHRKEKKRRCTICSKGMDKVHLEGGGVRVDACPGHGLWGDAGELREILEAACVPGDPRLRSGGLVRLLDEVFFDWEQRSKEKEEPSCLQGR